MTASQYLQLTHDNLTLLHHIAFSGNIEALEKFKSLSYFSEIVNDANNEVYIKVMQTLTIQEGWTPVLWAASKKHLSVVKALVEEGNADLTKPKKDGMNILHIAAS